MFGDPDMPESALGRPHPRGRGHPGGRCGVPPVRRRGAPPSTLRRRPRGGVALDPRARGRVGATAETFHLGGASAGAALCVGVTKRLRDGAGAMPRSPALAYPLVHGELPALSEDLRAAIDGTDGFVFSPEIVREMNVNYVGTEHSLDGSVARFAANGDVSASPGVHPSSGAQRPGCLRRGGYAAQRPLRRSRGARRVRGRDRPWPSQRAVHPRGERSLERIVAWLEEQ